MARIGTRLGILTDHEFEALVRQELHGRHDELPAPDQLAQLLEHYEVTPEHAEWAQSVALRALTKLVISGGDRRRADCNSDWAA